MTALRGMIRSATIAPMADVTQILSQIEDGDPHAAEQLLPLVYDELRKLAAAKMAHEKPGQTLQATALVHEAYLKLVDVHRAKHWDSRGHFFAAAAEAMRRILVGQARKRAAEKRGGDFQRMPLDAVAEELNLSLDDFLDLNDALSRLEESDPEVQASRCEAPMSRDGSAPMWPSSI